MKKAIFQSFLTSLTKHTVNLNTINLTRPKDSKLQDKYAPGDNGFNILIPRSTKIVMIGLALD